MIGPGFGSVAAASVPGSLGVLLLLLLLPLLPLMLLLLLLPLLQKFGTTLAKPGPTINDRVPI
jgi:hypothetical protein